MAIPDSERAKRDDVPRWRRWRWYREPFPTVSWQYMGRFMLLPLLWLIAVGAAYIVAIVLWIAPDNRWSAAEVFLGFAGGGAALAALAGVAKQLEPRRPKLRIYVQEAGAGVVHVGVINDGQDTAYGLELTFLNSPGDPQLLQSGSHWTGGWDPEFMVSRYTFGQPLPPGGDAWFGAVGDLREDRLQASAINALLVTWRREG